MASSDSEDEDLKLAIALSLQSENDVVPTAFATDGSSNVTDASKDPESSTSCTIIANRSQPSSLVDGNGIGSESSQTRPFTSLQALDRKQMEAERLARRKRQAEDALENAPQTKKIQSATVSSQLQPQINGKKLAVDVNNKPKSVVSNALQFPNGAVRRTFSSVHPRNGDIKLEEILLKDELNIGVFSSYMWDKDWLFGKFDTKRSKFYLAMITPKNEDPEEYKDRARRASPSSIRYFWPPMDGNIGNMHMKFMLLFYAGFLRIVVTSANLTAFDWGETGVLENLVFLIDLPRLPDSQRGSKDSLTQFGKELLYLLEKSTAPTDAIEGILSFDFAKTQDIAFIHSVGGASFGVDQLRTGFNSLARGIVNLNLKPKGALHIEYATGSIGALNDGVLQSLHNAAKGIANTGTSTRSAGSNVVGSRAREHLRVYFPTHETVLKSRTGLDGAGTICLNESDYQKPTFPKELLRDHVSTRKGMLSHSKIMLGYSDSNAWVYIGSHNFTESAWGMVSKDRSRNQFKMTCRNWECGVLLPAWRKEADDKEPNEDLRSLFSPVLDLPFEVPSQPNKQPWFFSKYLR